MRFSIAAILGLAAVATAQSITGNTTVSATSQVSSAASSAPTSKTPQELCLQACSATDICCQARCVNVPCPNGSQVNATTECAAKCTQGNGTNATATAGASGSHSAGAAGATTTGAGALASGTGSASATGSSASATHNAAAEVRFGAASMGLIGLIVAGLAL